MKKYIIFLVVLLGWMILFVFHPYFKISRIDIKGSERIVSEDISKKVKELINEKNYFFITERRVASFLKANFPIEDVKIKKIFPHSLEIFIKEKWHLFIYDNGEKYFLIDRSGQIQDELRAVRSDEVKTIFQPVTSTIHFPDTLELHKSFGKFPVVYDQSKQFNKDNIFDINIINSIIDAYTKINLITQDDMVHHFEFDKDNVLFINVILNNGLVIKFLSSADEDLWNNFEHLWNQIKNINDKPLEYIDLRLKGKAFYK